MPLRFFMDDARTNHDGRARPRISLVLYVGATVLLGSLLAYPLHDALVSVTDWPFYRVLRRAIMLAALAGLPAFLYATGVATRVHFGFDCERARFLRLMAGSFAVGLLTALPVIGALLALGVRTLSASPAEALDALPETAAAALVTALTVGLVEEAYFRGAVMGAWLRAGRFGEALVASSVFFAAVHFLVAERVPEPVGWRSGFDLVAAGLGGLLSEPATVGAFFALLAAGLLLGAMRARYGHIAACIGFHAGWVAVITVTAKVTDVRPDHGLAWLVGPTDGVVGWLAFGWIAAMCAAFLAHGRVHERLAS